jgi:hypothetical protein
MERARRHQRLLSILAFGLLALAAELVGRSLTHRVDIGRHVPSPSYAGADYYPILLAVVKVSVALLLARLAWRVVRARAAERKAERLLGRAMRRPRVRVRLSPRLWLAFFSLTSVIYLLQADAEHAAAGRWPLLGPWLHSSALPAFALVSVVCALLWRAVQTWLAEYEEYVEEAVARASRLAGRPVSSARRPVSSVGVPPRRLFGLVFESRPPPLAA